MHLKTIGHGEEALVILGGAGARAALMIPKARRYSAFRCYLAESQEPFEPALAAEEIEKSLREMGVFSFHLIGISLGACTALALASLFHKSVKTLTLCAPFPALPQKTRAVFETLLSLRQEEKDPEFLSLWKDVLYGIDAAPANFPLPEKESFCAQMRCVLAFDHTRFSPPACPVRVTLGIEDRLIPPALSRALADFLGAEVYAFPGGHMHFLHSPFPDFDTNCNDS